MRLTQVPEVSGCRAILPDRNSVIEVLAGLRHNWEIITIDDDVPNPKATGYRAIHVVTRKEGVAIELQRRTPGHQEWADEGERIDIVTEYQLRNGDGPERALAHTRKLAEDIDDLATVKSETHTQYDAGASRRKLEP
jgi:putative GTP pyrophosphokinase